MSSEKYIGLDVHQATISVAVMDSRGKLVMESIVETKAATILEFFAGLRGTLFVTLLRELSELSTRRYVSAIDFASIYAGLGEKDLAFASLEKAYQQRDPRLIIWLNLHPEFDTLRSDPRMKDLLRRIGLP